MAPPSSVKPGLWPGGGLLFADPWGRAGRPHAPRLSEPGKARERAKKKNYGKGGGGANALAAPLGGNSARPSERVPRTPKRRLGPGLLRVVKGKWDSGTRPRRNCPDSKGHTAVWLNRVRIVAVVMRGTGGACRFCLPAPLGSPSNFMCSGTRRSGCWGFRPARASFSRWEGLAVALRWFFFRPPAEVTV
ncbi:hypothetical protein AGDE_14921 [Angomonas deanei]|uniref:Uncharacterized protein n=1 Tax=Angomonas deanei TaxID=59799 RepID=A0A7G2CNQ1_9TRYP|nr:hypothetical protein AGDE_14921 [Angomonas deanei]CAD2220737.1 hypothetical protein, conserved [Angomonas deanei]|eukprot:EPY19993.1 hypothetical protein AGDE_14921 [Angomonas deanei]